MKFSLDKNSLEEQLSIVSRAINNKSTLPVLNNVLLKVSNGTLTFSTTNLEIAIETSLAVQNAEDGETTVPVKLFLNYIALLRTDRVEVSLNEHQILEIRAKNSETNIKTIPSTEFPLIPSIEEQFSIRLSAHELALGLSQTVFAAAIDESRPTLAGVYITAKEKKLYLVATDSYRLAEKQIDLQENVSFDVIVPSRTILELVRILMKQPEGEVTLQASKNQIVFTLRDIKLTSRLIEGKYPDYKRIIPETLETSTKIKISDLVTIVKRVNLFAKESSNNIKVSFTSHTLECISDTAQVGGETAVMECEVEGPEKLIAFNAEYLIEALNNIGDDETIFGCNSALSPGVLQNPNDESYIHIIMPLKI